ncbi:MAG TPA: glycoside hydrolase domain-containing protein [Beijerinckiaceae bacterium]|jgi:hypothetical protein
MVAVIDTNRDTTAQIGCLKTSGVNTIIRYYNRDGTPKVIKRREADAILAAGLSLMIVHQRGGRDPDEYSPDTGKADASHCRDYGGTVIGQPSGSAIYFAVDFDISKPDINAHVVPFFEAVNEEMSQSDGRPTYRIGVYGSGLTCKTLLDMDLVKLTWLSQSTGFRGTPEFNASRRWNLLQLLPQNVCGISVDPNIVNPDKPDFGQFGAGGRIPAPAPGPDGVVRRFRVIARDGLRLRSGPGLEFDRLGLLPFGTVVTAVRREGEWTFVDLQGDGAVDGAVFSALLSPLD